MTNFDNVEEEFYCESIFVFQKAPALPKIPFQNLNAGPLMICQASTHQMAFHICKVLNQSDERFSA